MLTLTPSAAKRVQELCRRQEYAKLRSPGLRVKVVGGGCAGLSYAMEIEDGPKPQDAVLEFEGAKVYVDAKSALFLSQVELDFLRKGMMGSSFEFRNPAATGTCGCGSSFSV